jgi:hypothetical protein
VHVEQSSGSSGSYAVVGSHVGSCAHATAVVVVAVTTGEAVCLLPHAGYYTLAYVSSYPWSLSAV